MTTEIVWVEFDIANGHFSLMWMYSWIGLSKFIRLEHEKHSSFASIIKTEEDNLGTFLEKAKPFEAWFDIVPKKHVWFLVIFLFENKL